MLRVYFKNAFGCNTCRRAFAKKNSDAKRLVSKLGLEAKKIDCCMDDCMFYYNNDVVLTECKFANKPRYCAKTN